MIRSDLPGLKNWGMSSPMSGEGRGSNPPAIFYPGSASILIFPCSSNLLVQKSFIPQNESPFGNDLEIRRGPGCNGVKGDIIAGYAKTPVVIIRIRDVVILLAGFERSRQSLHSTMTGSPFRAVPSSLLTHPTNIPLFTTSGDLWCPGYKISPSCYHTGKGLF
jgi:hypothetical protein